MTLNFKTLWKALISRINENVFYKLNSLIIRWIWFCLMKSCKLPQWNAKSCAKFFELADVKNSLKLFVYDYWDIFTLRGVHWLRFKCDCTMRDLPSGLFSQRRSPWELPRVKSKELIAGYIKKTGCDCVRRNGLQVNTFRCTAIE